MLSRASRPSRNRARCRHLLGRHYPLDTVCARHRHGAGAAKIRFQHIHILITGAEKRAAYERALTLPPDLAPVACVLPQATVHWAD